MAEHGIVFNEHGAVSEVFSHKKIELFSICFLRMASRTSGTSSSQSRSNRQGRRTSTVEDSLVNYVYALREGIDEMTGVEEALVDRINHLTVGLEGCLREVNLLHQRLNILTSLPLVPIIIQKAWNVVHEVIIPAEWYNKHP
ncbi:hypothetical protein Hanom_Chr14g01263321 [Helianthus anomalus]